MLFTVAMVSTHEVQGCTSFMLRTKQGLFFVHSLNQGNVPSVQGMIFFNQRNVWKKGFSWENLVKMHDGVEPSLIWKSKYGSVTFNPFAKELIDGGMNEAGLYIWEMNFNTKYPDDPQKPKLFQCQWMQYVLDNFKTVEEVIDNAHRMSIDGWGWHYFVADASGKTAIIDFIDGNPFVYTGDAMPVPICCNAPYSENLRWLRFHEEFGGELSFDPLFKEIPRFITGAVLMGEFADQDPVEYSFNMLEAMSKNVRWSVVIDVSRMKVYFNTNLNKDIRHFTMDKKDFGRKQGLLMLDIDCPGPGDVRKEFTGYDVELDRRPLKSIIELICSDDEYRESILQGQAFSIDEVVRSISEKLEWPGPDEAERIAGEWTGKMIFPTDQGDQEIATALVLKGENDRLSGTMNDGTVIMNLTLTNTAYRGGILTFTLKVPESKDLVFCQLYRTLEGWKGYGEVWGQRQKASFYLSRSD